MKALFARLAAFSRALASELERVLPRPVVPLVASLAIHLMLLPFVYVVMLFEPEPEQSRVFMLEGGLALGDGRGSEWDDDDEDEDWEDVLDEEDDEDDDWDDEAVDTDDSEKFDRWGFPLPGAFEEDEEKDEDWDSDWFKRKWGEDDEADEEEEDDDDIIDDDLEEDEEDDVDLADLEKYDIEIEEERDEEEIEEEIERFGTDVKKWDTIFADSDGEATDQPPAIKPEPSAMDGKILAFIERNPYEDISAGNEAGPWADTSGVDFSDFDARLPELLDWMPPDSLMAALISLELLRARPDREELERTFKSLGYFRQIAGGSELSFFEDVDAVLIASSDPLDVEETFVILRHGLEEDSIREAIDRQFKSLKLKSNWYEVDGRSVVQPDKEHFEELPWVYFMPRPGYVAVLHVSKRDRLTTYMGSESFGPGASSRLIGDLERHMRFGLITPMIEAGIVDKDGNPTALVEPRPVAVVLGCIMFQDAFKDVVDGSPFPSPSEVMLMGRFGEEGDIGLKGDAHFESEEAVDGFLAQWLKHVAPLRKNKLLKLIGAVDLIDLVGWKRRDDGRLSLEAEVDPDDVARLMALVRLLTAEPQDKLAGFLPKHEKPSKPKKSPKKPK